MTTPSGSPAWTRTAGIAQYGGHADKKNHLSIGVVDPLTDVGAEAFQRITADLAAIAKTAPFCVLQVTCNDGTPAAPTVDSLLQMNGTDTDGYEGDASPSGFPSLARNGDGDFTITFASSYSDDYSQSGAFAVKFADGGLASSSAGTVTVETAATTVRVRCWDGAGSALADAVCTITVW